MLNTAGKTIYVGKAGDLRKRVSSYFQRSITDAKTAAMMKLVVDGDTDRVLGCHMVGMDAPEIMQGFGVALKAGATKAVFDSTIGIHPTSAEEFVTMREPVADAAE